MLERESRETGDQALLEESRSGCSAARLRDEPYGPAADDADRVRVPSRRGQPFEADEDFEPREPTAGGETRKGWLGRHPIVSVFALLCLALALPAGYFYWDYTSHFETTDDAYIASRQFPIAPEVSGYITAVPVTDNEHVQWAGIATSGGEVRFGTRAALRTVHQA